MYNPFSLENKTILVTGASSGIGRATAIECSRMGAKVILTARNEERLKETLSLMEDGNHRCIVADLSEESEIDNLVNATGQIDGLVNNAGCLITLPLTFINENKQKGILNVNTIAPILITQKLLKMKKINKNASVVFTSSISGPYCAAQANSLYTVSKAAICGFVKSAAVELASKGIRVNAVCPSMVETNIMGKGVLTEEQLEQDKKNYPLGRYGKPVEVAYAIVYLLSDASSYVTGTNLVIDGGITSKY